MHAGVAKSYHLSNWCKDLEQTDITLNMMHPCTQNSNLSVHEALEGITPWNRMHDTHQPPPPAATHGATTSSRLVVTDTGAVRLADTFTFLHHSLPTPTISNADRIIKAIQHLDRTIKSQLLTQPDESHCQPLQPHHRNQPTHTLQHH
ncbi:LOW QUALITY PROTEIN: hypothetical protein ACHAW6_005314 [Cyclotella cf. meneghiniana]